MDGLELKAKLGSNEGILEGIMEGKLEGTKESSKEGSKVFSFVLDIVGFSETYVLGESVTRSLGIEEGYSVGMLDELGALLGK